MISLGTYSDFVQAMERVERRLREVTAALNKAGIRYAVIGGNTVSIWVAKSDPAATRTTKNVDLLVERSDVDRIAEILSGLGFRREDPCSLILFIDPDEPSRKSGVHLVWAGQKVRTTYEHPAPTLDEAVMDPQGFLVLRLEALVRTKLTSFRPLDQVHIADLFGVNLITDKVRDSLQLDLRKRLDAVATSLDDYE